MKNSFKFIATIYLSLAAILVMYVSCTGKQNLNLGGPTEVDKLGNYFTGGFITSLAFDPSDTSTVWASGDDGTGLFYSGNNGLSWARASLLNQSSYCLRFDPGANSYLYAPNHFGRGLVRSINGGTSFTTSQAGLPSTSSSSQLLYDLAINPTNSFKIAVATDAGLYVSVNQGVLFSLATATGLSGNTQYRAVAFRADGILFAGKSDGAFGYSADNGATFTQLSAPNSVAIDSIAISPFWVYVGSKDGTISRFNITTFASTKINDPAVAGSILNLNRLQINVVAGSANTNDKVLVATSGNSTITGRYGLALSTNSGASFAFKILNKSIMSVAMNPANTNIILAGSGSAAGVWLSTNGGTSFTLSNSGLNANGTTGLAIDPSNSKHLVVSYSAGGGYGTNYENMNGGTTWSTFADPTSDDGVFAFDIDPASASNILAGMNTKGIWRSTSGTAGPWSQIVNLTTNVDRFVRDQITTSKVYAVSPAGASGASLYVSADGGASFAAAAGVVANNIATHPTTASEAIVANGTDVYASADSFATQAALNLAALPAASGEGGFTAVAYTVGLPTQVVVGGKSGGLYVTPNYVASGSGTTWSKLTTPIVNAQVRDVAAVYRNGHSVFYALAFSGGTSFSASSTPGLFYSIDAGTTWKSYNGSLTPPSTLGWRLIADPTDATSTITSNFFIGMWAGGPFKLIDSQ